MDYSLANSSLARKTSIEVGLVSSFLLYILFAMAVIQNAVVGYAGLASIFLVWVGYSVLQRDGVPVIPRVLLILALLFTVVISVDLLFWPGAYDSKDIVGLYLFYIIIPSIYVSLNKSFDNVGAYTDKAIAIFFFIVSAGVVIDIVISGFSVYRSTIFGFNKNAVAFFFEVLYCYLLFESRDRSGMWTATIMSVGMVTLMLIFSKTSIAFGLVFTMGYVFPQLFLPALFGLGVVGGVLTFTYDRASLTVLGTAVDRALLWFDAIDKITHSWTRFLFGYGPGTFVSTVSQFSLAGKTAIHNYFLQIAHGFGAVMLAVILGFFYWIYRRFGVIRSGAAAAFWIFNMHSFFDVGWVTGQGFLASLIVGLLLTRRES